MGGMIGARDPTGGRRGARTGAACCSSGAATGATAGSTAAGAPAACISSSSCRDAAASAGSGAAGSASPISSCSGSSCPAPSGGAEAEMCPDEERHVLVDRAGVGLLLGYAEPGQEIENHAWFHLELPRQLIDSDFLHRERTNYSSPNSRQPVLHHRGLLGGFASPRRMSHSRRSMFGHSNTRPDGSYLLSYQIPLRRPLLPMKGRV